MERQVRILAGAQEERARALRQDRVALDDAVRERLIAVTTNFDRSGESESAKPRTATARLRCQEHDACSILLPRRNPIHVRFKVGKPRR